MALAAGTRLGPYEIVAPLGEGGMGEVYRARDTKLGRDVALKLLPPQFAEDAERRARFEREARTLAALNHPHIAHLHGLEESGDHRALVMELVEGQTLAERISRGAIPLGEALPLAKQLAEALEYAHEHGVIHRDLKPANVKITPDGAVKVLDFGLAKALEGGPLDADLADSPTITSPAMTQAGVILGTAAYMSPEQARGKPVDRRADIWAFGAVLYEMLSGRRAFGGDDVSSTLASVIKDEPRWAGLPADLPASLVRLLRRCLEKDPKRRLSAIGDARLDLDELTTPSPSGQASAPAPVRLSLRTRLWPAVAGMIVTAGIAGALWPRAAAPPDATVVRLSVLPPPGRQFFPDSAMVAMSPDGTKVAFIIGAVIRGYSELWVRSLDSMTARRVEGGDGASLPFWSPDGHHIGFFDTRHLKVVPASGGRVQTLCEAPNGRGAVWMPSNVILFAPNSSGPLHRIPATGGTPEPVTTLDAAHREYSHRFPSLLPDGVHFLYAALPGKNGRFDIFAGSLEDKTRTPIGAMEASPVFAEPGWLLYGRQGGLTALPFDPRALKITGDPVALEDEPAGILDPAWAFTAGWSTSISRTGSLTYYSSQSTNTIATWYDAAGETTGTLNVPPGHYDAVAIAPDGGRAVMVKSALPSQSSLVVVDLSRGSSSPLSTGSGRNDTPVWSPDGRQVVWASDRDGFQNLFVKTVDDPAPERLVFASDIPFKRPASWTPDGKWIVITQLDPETGQDVWLLDASGTLPPTALVRGPQRDVGGPVSPDGRWITYSAGDSGRFELYAQPFPRPGPRVQISDQGGAHSWWAPDGRQVVYLSSDFRTLNRVDVQPGPALRVGTPRLIARLPPDVIAIDAMPDRRRFLVLTPERTGGGSITIVQHWRAALTHPR